ncbi:hypothetical protein E2C01_046721 [Portunus trituberculatus]|uniref:Uncharacterized protein n=1 Tax=Portunus trituberculatus TaxID=210409 RepID=A0A5B7G1Q7_PORTR|nr:hypothetical protein [Portunus trituberculatus]
MAAPLRHHQLQQQRESINQDYLCWCHQLAVNHRIFSTRDERLSLLLLLMVLLRYSLLLVLNDSN